jgi:hypothetical protein
MRLWQEVWYSDGRGMTKAAFARLDREWTIVIQIQKPAIGIRPITGNGQLTAYCKFTPEQAF